MQTIRNAAAVGCISLGLATGCSGSVPDDPEQVAATKQAIVNGTVESWNWLNAVAIYHQVRNASGTFVWSERPCSGRVLTPRSQYKAILTARHCVSHTVDEWWVGPVVNSNQIRITAELAPGPASPNPPSNAVQPYHVGPFPAPTNGYLGLTNPFDLAILWVDGQIPGLEPNPPKVGLYLGSTQSLGDVGAPQSNLFHWGYGQGTAEQNSTAGVLRRASGFAFDDVYNIGDYGPFGVDNQGYFYTNPNPSGQMVYFGDSGGPALRTGGAFWHQVGVHSTDEFDVAVARRSVEWMVSQHLGRLYIRSHLHNVKGLKWSGYEGQASVTLVPAAAEVNQWWTYDWMERSIRIPAWLGGTTCLDLQWNNPADNTPIWMWPCNSGAAQKWLITAHYQIKSEVHGKCIELTNDLRMVLKGCQVVDRQKWMFDPDSGVAGGY
jgi:hypothetical protein